MVGSLQLLLWVAAVALVPRQAAARFQGSGARDTVHKVFKVKVTDEWRAPTSWSGGDGVLLLKADKRGDDASACPTSYALCAASLGGNCCPDNYACSKDYCYATTAVTTSTATCQGNVGYYACAASLGGGCCPQGLLCATGNDCLPPAGATHSTTCPTGYFQCPSSASYGCCMNGMGCAVDSCYSTAPSTTTIKYTTTDEDGSSTKVVTSTSVTTPTGDATSAAGAGAVPKYYASTVSKSPATSTSTSDDSDGRGGLSKGAIGGIIAGVVLLLLAVVTAAYLIIKRLKKTAAVVQSVRETTSGTRTRRTADKKSEISQVVRVRPTQSEVDQMDCDPLMMTNNNSSMGGSPRGSRHLRGLISSNLNGRARGDSDAESQQPSLWSGPSAGMRWNTPSVGSDPGGDGGAQKEYFELPPRTHVQSTNTPTTTTTTDTSDAVGRPQMPMRASMESSSQYSYRNYGYGHGRHWSNASELSAGSDENNGSQHDGGAGSPLMRGINNTSTPPAPPPQELGVEGEFRPELPGSDTETESNHGSSSRPRPPRRRSTGIVSPMSAIATATTTNHNNIASRRRGNSGNTSLISPVEEETNDNRSDGEQQQHRRALGSIDESVSTVMGTESSQGHFGRPITGLDMAGAPTSLGLSLMGGMDDEETNPGRHDDGRQGKST